MPEVTEDLATFLRGQHSMMVASRDPSLRPSICRGFGLQLSADLRDVALWMPERPSKDIVRDLQANGPLAVIVGEFLTHRAVQLKATGAKLRPVRDDERNWVDSSFQAFVKDCARIGLPPAMFEGADTWPAIRLDFRIEQVFDQSPGPGAGGHFRGGVPA